MLFTRRSKRGILSSLPAELEITGSVEVTDCFSRMFIASPRPNDQPLCHAVLVSLKLNVKMSSEGKQVYSSYFNLCEILETTSSTMWTSCQKSSAEMVVLQDCIHRFKSCYNCIVATGQKMVSEKIEIPPKILYVEGTFLKFCTKGSENWRRLLWSQGGECSLSKYKKLYIHETGITKLKKWLEGEAGDLSVSYIIFPIYLDREILFFSWKSQGILSTHVCDNHGSK